MDNKKDYSCVEKNEKVFSKNIEVENDFSEAVPAYCDDIYRIVKCCSHSSISTISIQPPEVRITGKCVIKLTYYNESSSLCYADFEEDFSTLLSIDNLSDYAFANSSICDKYTNFRVINQRKIDIHSAATISLSVYDRVKYPCLRSCEGAKLKSQSIKSADIIASNISKIEFDEEFSIPADSKPINRIVSSDYSASLIETKIIKDKVLIKAEVTAKILYSSGDEELSKVSNTFSISKIVELSGIEENDILICNISVSNAFQKAKSNSGDMPGSIEAFGDISVNCLFIREEDTEYITDGYMLKNSAECSYCDYKAYSNAKYINESKLFSLNLDFSNEIKEIKELSVNLQVPSIRNGKLISKAEVSVIYENESGSLASMNTTGEISIDASGRELAIASFSIKTLDYTLSSSKSVELRLGVDINAYCFDLVAVKMLADISEGEEVPQMPSLSIYFAKENESVWDIAKSFSSDESMIIKENSLTKNTLDNDKILIIPRV
jgi:hypothetical protein